MMKIGSSCSSSIGRIIMVMIEAIGAAAATAQAIAVTWVVVVSIFFLWRGKGAGRRGYLLHRDADFLLFSVFSVIFGLIRSPVSSFSF